MKKIYLTTDDKLSYISSDNRMKTMINEKCKKDHNELKDEGKIEDLIDFLRCRYETAYLYKPKEVLQSLENKNRISQTNYSNVYKTTDHIRSLIWDMVVKDPYPKEEIDKEFNLRVENIKTLYPDVIHEIFIEQHVIQPYIIENNNRNFPSLFSSFVCKSDYLIRPGKTLCKKEDQMVVKLYSLYEFIKGGTMHDMIVDTWNDSKTFIPFEKMKDILLQVFGNLALLQTDKMTYNHNDLHFENIMIEELDDGKQRVVIIDQGLASCTFKKDDDDNIYIANSWYRRDLSAQDLPIDLQGFDVFRLLTVLYAGYYGYGLDMNDKNFKAFSDMLFSFFERYGLDRVKLEKFIKNEDTPNLDILPTRFENRDLLFLITYKAFFDFVRAY